MRTKNDFRETAEIKTAMKKVFPEDLKTEDVIFICIGTDRSTGDSLGPIIGSELIKLGYKNVYGTLDEPAHAQNLSEVQLKINKQHPDKKIIAFDACLGQVSSIGCICISDGPVRPGAGVNKDLGTVGDYHITGIVNVGGFMEYFVLQNTRLNLVFKMASCIITAIQNQFPLEVPNVSDGYSTGKKPPTADKRNNAVVEEEWVECDNAGQKKCAATSGNKKKSTGKEMAVEFYQRILQLLKV